MGANQPSEGHASAGAKLLNLLASVKFAVTVVILIAIACLVGTLLPQGTEVAEYLQKYPAASDRMELFDKLGLTHVYSSWWFLGLLGVLAASVATCSTRRFATVRRTTGFARRRALGSMISHISMLLIIAGGVIRGVWGEKGYLELHEGQTQTQFQVDQGSRPLPFGLHLAKFEIERDSPPGEARNSTAESDSLDQLLVQWPERKVTAQFPAAVGVERVVAPEGETPAAENSFRVKIIKYVPDFIVDMTTREVTSRSSQPNNPAILVEVNGPNYKNHRWLFAKFPDFVMHTAEDNSTRESPLRMVYQNQGATPKPPVSGPIKSFKSTLDVVEGNQVVRTNVVVEVNSPFQHKGYTFYQFNYNPRDLSWTSLQVVRDPSVPVVYAGFSLLIAGLFIVFYLNPWIENRKVSKHASASALKHLGTQAQ